MCGFVGWHSDIPIKENQKIECYKTLAKMMGNITHRGPDNSGVYLKGNVALGHQRLSIIDTSDAGSQPMTLDENGPVLVYNGEIYNFLDLRQSLSNLGHKFKSTSDTEVVLRAYLTWGIDGLTKLEGIFALAIYDTAKKELILMRDRLGVKPLYFGHTKKGFTFGSNISALKSAKLLNKDLDEQALSEYLWFGNAHEDRTFYAGVRQLQPGQVLIKSAQETKIKWWFRIEEYLQPNEKRENFKKSSESLRQILDSAVSKQLVSDVPIGLFLSGGLDSSTLAASAALQDKDIISFSACFDYSSGSSEHEVASTTAEMLNLKHSVLEISGSSLEQTLFDLAKSHSEPFADAANIPLYLMSRRISEEFKVVLQGDGGDELFAGYRRYKILKNSKFWGMIPKRISYVSSHLGSYGNRASRIMSLMQQKDPAIMMGLLLTTEVFDKRPEQYFLPEMANHLQTHYDPMLAYKNAAERFMDQKPVQKMLLTDLTVQLPSQFLTKVDRATMAASVEARVPFLDETVVKFALNIPAAWKVRRNISKYILRRSQLGRLPKQILKGKKYGFGVPYSHWLATSLNPLLRELVLDENFVRNFGFDKRKLERSVDHHKSDNSHLGYTLWKIFQLAIWHNENA